MRVGILTSGGDAPGMNAAIRAAVRCGTGLDLEMVGIRRGFAGLVDGDLIPLDNRTVGGIIEHGGTILRSARSEAFLTQAGRQSALDTVESSGLSGLVIIGGDGSLKGAHWLDTHGVPSIGIPASIDNDIYGTGMAIGTDTALNTVVESLNRIRDTAISHGRVFVVEVMGRTSGYIALMGGLAGGAEIVLIPEIPISLDRVATLVKQGQNKGKLHSIIVVAEGFCPKGSPKEQNGSAGQAVNNFLNENKSIEPRLTILGHLQRGGSPSAFDRILGCRLGGKAVQLLKEGKAGVAVGLSREKIIAVPLEKMGQKSENIDLQIYDLVYKIAS
ncbi:MAG: 6-phosphofructokinase [Candidatus Bipolaricaulota bacterium]|nr:6-phosphofructokinase [Candidatus Bipolaricaulota bacterium]